MDPYIVLGVSRNCTRRQVQRTFRAKVQRAHPDRGGEERNFIRLCTAYRMILADLDARQGFRRPGAGRQRRRPPEAPVFEVRPSIIRPPGHGCFGSLDRGQGQLAAVTVSRLRDQPAAGLGCQDRGSRRPHFLYRQVSGDRFARRRPSAVSCGPHPSRGRSRPRRAKRRARRNRAPFTTGEYDRARGPGAALGASPGGGRPRADPFSRYQPRREARRARCRLRCRARPKCVAGA